MGSSLIGPGMGGQGSKGSPQPLRLPASYLAAGRGSERQDQCDQEHRLPR